MKNQSTYWMIFELIWRDFFKFISLKYGNRIFKIGGILEKNILGSMMSISFRTGLVARQMSLL